MMLKILLYPDYFDHIDAQLLSPLIFGHLAHKGIAYDCVPWDGEAGSIPTDEKVMVMGNEVLALNNDTVGRIVEKCREYGHFFFYYARHLDGSDVFLDELA